MPFTDTHGDDWAVVVETYKDKVHGVAEASVSEMLERTNAALPFKEATGILDNGCGPGAVIQTLLSKYGNLIPEQATLDCTDFSSPMIDSITATKADRIKADPASPWNRVRARVSDATDMQIVQSESMSHILAGWVYFGTPSPQKCLTESLRMLKPSGVLCASSWKGSQWLDIMMLINKVRPDRELPPIPTPWASTAGLRGEFEQAGFRDVEAYEVPVYMSVVSHESFLHMLCDTMPPVLAVTRDWSDEEKAQLRHEMGEELKRVCPNVPSKLSGTSLVAVGRK